MADKFHIVAFTRDNRLSQDDQFFWIGRSLLQRSDERLPSFLSHSDAECLEYAVVRRLVRIKPTLEVYLTLSLLPPEVRQLEEGKDISIYLHPPPEYDKYEMVYFLNDVALKMYREGGVEFAILKTVTADQLPEQSEECLVGPYVSLAEAN